MEKNNLKWFPAVMALFVTTLIVSNIIAVKLVNIFDQFLPAAVILFPVAYIFGDVLTEVYGYARARQVIWVGFFCNLVAVIAIYVAGLLPAAPFWTLAYDSPDAAQLAYDSILGFTARLLLASFVAYLIGEFLNSYVLAKLKVKTEGKHLWLRTITSTIVGQGVDSAIFITLAFYGIFASGDILNAILSQWVFKTAYETLATPLTYLAVNWLKKEEGLDHFDNDTNFSPIASV